MIVLLLFIFNFLVNGRMAQRSLHQSPVLPRVPRSQPTSSPRQGLPPEPQSPPRQVKADRALISLHDSATGSVISMVTRLPSASRSLSPSSRRFTFHIMLQGYVTEPNTNTEVKTTVQSLQSTKTIQSHCATKYDYIRDARKFSRCATEKKLCHTFFFLSMNVAVCSSDMCCRRAVHPLLKLTRSSFPVNSRLSKRSPRQLSDSGETSVAVPTEGGGSSFGCV